MYHAGTVKRQKTEENEERIRAPREESVLEQGVENGAARPAREEVEDEFNAACRECGIAFDERKRYRRQPGRGRGLKPLFLKNGNQGEKTCRRLRLVIGRHRSRRYRPIDHQRRR